MADYSYQNLTEHDIIKIIDELTEFDTINFRHNRIKSTNFLILLPNLKNVNLSHNLISEVGLIGSSITSMHLGNNPIKDVSFLRRSNVTRLSVNKECIICKRYPSYNWPGQELPVCCAVHRFDDMVMFKSHKKNPLIRKDDTRVFLERHFKLNVGLDWISIDRQEFIMIIMLDSPQSFEAKTDYMNKLKEMFPGKLALIDYHPKLRSRSIWNQKLLKFIMSFQMGHSDHVYKSFVRDY